MRQILFLILLSVLSLFKCVLLTAWTSDMYLHNRNYVMPGKVSDIFSKNNLQNGTTSYQNSEINYENLKNTNKFPIENMFKLTAYRLNMNTSSPCNYTGKAMLMKCHRVLIFDSNHYETAIKEARELILNRIGLKNEPVLRINQNTLKLLNDINKNFEVSSGTKSNSDNVESVKKTQFDKHDVSGGSKTVKIIRELTGTSILFHILTNFKKK